MATPPFRRRPQRKPGDPPAPVLAFCASTSPPPWKGHPLRTRHPRPAARRDISDRLKLHRHDRRLDGRDYTVITPRPGTDVRFSTNNFHDTWHILSDLRGARFIARLLWGLSYQRRPNTIVCIDPRFLDTNPFDAEPSDAIVFAPTPTSPFGAKAARDLDSRMPTGVGDGTVRWHTPGLDRFIDHTRHDVQGAWDAWTAKETGLHRHGDDLTITRRKGLLVFAAAPEILRTWALCAQRMSFAYFPMDYEYLDAWRTTHRGETGELQVFAEYRRMVSTARIARREVLSSSDAPSDPEHQRPAIWAHGDLVKRRSLRPRLGADLTRTRPR